MFAYNPPTQQVGHRYLYEGAIAAAQPMAEATMLAAQLDAAKKERQYQAIQDGVGLVGDAARAVAGFAMGGPAGAAMAAGGGGGEGGGGGGGLFNTIINAYAKKEQDKADSKIYGNLMKIVAPAFGKDGDSLLEQWNSLESDSDRASFGSTLLGSLGTISNMYMANNRLGVQQNQQALTAVMPGLRNQADAADRAARGENQIQGAVWQRNP